VRLCERLRGLNLGARLHTVLHGEIDPEKLFGAGLFDPAGKPPDVRAWINEPAYDGAAGSHQHHHGDGVHDARVRAFCLSFDVPLEWGALSEWLARLRRWHGEHLLRVKGILNLVGEAALSRSTASTTCSTRPCSSGPGPTPTGAPGSSSSRATSAARLSLREAMPALAKAG